MVLVSHLEVQNMPNVLCLDIRESTKHLPISGGINIPHHKINFNKGLLQPFVGQNVVIFCTNHPERCRRAATAEAELRKLGFNQIFGIKDGLMNGWIMPTRKSPYPGSTI